MRQKRKTRDRDGARRNAKRAANSAPESAEDQDVRAGDQPEDGANEPADADAVAEPEADEDAAGEASAEDDSGEVSEREGEASEDEAGEDEASEGEAGDDDGAERGVGRIKSIVESLLFASDKPLTVKRIAQLTRERDHARIQAALTELTADYDGRGIVLHDVAGGWQLRTAPHNSRWVQQLVAGRPVRLTRAQLETLAIIAYRQPITRPEIDDIRGVDSGGTLRVLLERQLIRVLGKKEEPGRPLLYGTTKGFLEFFNLNDLRDLPTLREYHELTEDSMRMVERLSEKLPPGHEVSADDEDDGEGDSERVGADDPASDGARDAGAGDEDVDDHVSAEEALDEEAPAEHGATEEFGEDAPDAEASEAPDAEAVVAGDADDDDADDNDDDDDETEPGARD